MLNGLYSAAAGMYASQTWIDALSSDIANVSTDGYRAQRIGFRDLLPNREQTVSVGSGAAVVDAGREFSAGAMEQSSSPLSVTIAGQGFLQVRREDGTVALTRAGDLRTDAQGQLETAAGHRLVPPVRIPVRTPADEISIGTDGTVTASGRKVGKITIVNVTAPAFLRVLDDTEFAATAQSGPVRAARDATIVSGYLEGSNVDLSTAMVSMIQAQRNYDLDSRAIQTQDQLMQIANEIRQ